MDTGSSATSESLLRITYLSQAEKEISARDLQDLLTSARAFNTEHGITGILIHSFGCFLQVLEGPEETLLRLYLKISADKRHGRVTLMHAIPIRSRMFREWAMACLGEKDGISINFEDLLRSRFDMAGDTATKVLLDRFLARIRTVDAN